MLMAKQERDTQPDEVDRQLDEYAKAATSAAAELDRQLAELAKNDPDLADRLERDRRRAERLPARIRFAHRLRTLLQYHGLTHGQVAARTGFSAKQISRYVNADHSEDGRVPELHDLHRLAAGLGVSAGYFVDVNPPEQKLMNRGELPELEAEADAEAHL